MVVITLKRGDEALFLLECPAATPVAAITKQAARMFNNIQRIDRLAMAMQSLAEHGICKPPEMQGLTDEQIVELKLRDTFSDTCYPSGGARSNPDPIGKRTGNAPSERLGEVLLKTAVEAKAMVSKDLVKAGRIMTEATITEALDRCRGAVMIVYPMGLPPHEEAEQILANTEDLAGTQASQTVVPEDQAQLWWAGKELLPEKALSDYIGRNEKTKIVAKLQRRGAGAPSREAGVDEETQKQMMAFAYRKQEEWKKLESADDDSYLDSKWADSGSLRRQLQGVASIRLR